MIDIQHINILDCHETEQAVICPSVAITTTTFKTLQEIDQFLKKRNIGDIILKDDLGAEIELTNGAECPAKTINGRYSIQKKGNYPIFFTHKGLIEYLERSSVISEIFILFFAQKGFVTEWSTYYGQDEIDSIITSENSHHQAEDIPKFVKSLNTEANMYLPISSIFWMANDRPEIPVWWKKIATAKLICSFPKELKIDRNTAELTFLGDRRINVLISLNSDQLASAFRPVQEISRWLYQEGKGTDTRHTIINNQVTLLPITDVELLKTDLKPVIEKIFAGAEMTYRYYLRDANKELNKNLTDLNKTLFEHLSKIRQNTMDLIGSLWRDFATAFGLLVLNFSLKKPDVSASYWNWLLYGLILYLAANLALTGNMGFWFYYRLRSSLMDMRNRIYGYLTDADYDIFALNPLQVAFEKFRKTFWWVALCYLAIIGLVLLALFHDKI